MNILAIDTASHWLSLALYWQGQVYQWSMQVGLQHAHTLLPAIDQLMTHSKADMAQIDLVVCMSGPGSFTGLRIGMATAKGLCAAYQIPMISVPTLQVYAKACHGQRVMAVLDARKNRYYVAIQENGQISTPYDVDVQQIQQMIGDTSIILTGAGAQALYHHLHHTGYDAIIQVNPAYDMPCAYFMLSLGQELYEAYGADTDNTGPNYLRDSDARQPL
jgi:tRNA threonylcarbamoyladenosine biosynthesis protein TsaB